VREPAQRVLPSLRQTTLGASPIRIAYLAPAPIIYQVPLLRRLAAEPDLNITTFFCSDVSLKAYDAGFGPNFKWDIPLLGGYEHEFLPALGSRDRVSLWRPFNYGLGERLRVGRFQILWVHGYMRVFNLAAIAVAKRLGVKVVIRDEATRISARRGAIRRIIKRVFFAGLGRLCDGFLAIGSLNREYYRWYDISTNKIFDVPYSVDNDFFESRARVAARSRTQLRAALGLNRDGPVILNVAKMTARKRAQDLLDAYAKLSPDSRAEPNASLVFVGDGEKRAELESRAAALGWNSIRFTGAINQTELPAYYDLCDIFVLPSIREPWGLVVNEAMSAGCAVVVSDQVGCGPDLVRHGQNGYTFRAGDIDQLAHTLKLITANPVRCREMGEKSREIIRGWSFEQDVIGLRTAVAHVIGALPRDDTAGISDAYSQ
jgi:glycosyltransferase involved in cell wall biosynthesis